MTNSLIFITFRHTHYESEQSSKKGGTSMNLIMFGDCVLKCLVSSRVIIHRCSNVVSLDVTLFCSNNTAARVQLKKRLIRNTCMEYLK